MTDRVRDLGDLVIPPFDRHFFDGQQRFTKIGTGYIGGKAHGLASMREVLGQFSERVKSTGITVEIPTLTVIASGHFEHFLELNDLFEVAHSEEPDYRIAHAFQRTELPSDLVGDLRALIAQVHTPLAVRSSSYLEDAMFQPFASVYATKMIPNNQADIDTRFRCLVEAVKFVYASTFFRAAKNYIAASDHTIDDERMAVVIQEIVGGRYEDRFYPQISGVVRSYNYYTFGRATAEDGVVELALGLGRAIVEDGMGWSYSPACPAVPPPFNSVSDLLKHTQTEFWAVKMGPPPPYDPIHDTEYLGKFDLRTAEHDGTLGFLASTYDPANDAIRVGIESRGPRALNFAPILEYNQIPLNEVIQGLKHVCEDTLGTPVEIELAISLDNERGVPARLGFLQVRPMVVSAEEIAVGDQEFGSADLLLSSEQVMGNGHQTEIRDIIYVKPDAFSPLKTWTMASQIDAMNRRLVERKRPYLLIGFGRWGSSDPALGIPVDFGQISGAKVIVETTLEGVYANFSQGSHFFHNMTSFRILYLFVTHESRQTVDWNWLAQQELVSDTEFVRWVRTESPLEIKVDGRKGRGVIIK